MITLFSSDAQKIQSVRSLVVFNSIKRDPLNNLVPFVQFKREKHPCRSVAFTACKFDKSNTAPWVFLTFCELFKWNQITQSITNDLQYAMKWCMTLCIFFKETPSWKSFTNL